MEGINIFILAAGKGSRLGKLTKNKPKILVKFEKKTILDHQLNIYSKLKKKKLYIVGGYKIKNLKKNIYRKKIQLIENNNFNKTNMYYSFLRGKKLLNQKRDLVIVYGDIIFKKLKYIYVYWFS